MAATAKSNGLDAGKHFDKHEVDEPIFECPECLDNGEVYKPSNEPQAIGGLEKMICVCRMKKQTGDIQQWAKLNGRQE